MTLEISPDWKRFKKKESWAWLHAFPSNNIGIFMDDWSFQINVVLRLGCDICKEFQCGCCGESKKCIHALFCLKNSDKYYRHAEANIIWTVLKKTLVSVNIPSQLEPVGWDGTDGKKPDGLTLILWRKGQCLIWASTCSDTFAKINLNLSKQRLGAAVDLAVERKIWNISN